MNSIAILASGSGTNADNIIRFFRTHPHIGVKLVITNRKNAGVIEKATNLGVEVVHMPKDEFVGGEQVVELLKRHEITHVILAGFLLLIPEKLIAHYPHKILNIHPALLPKYGGKGMYGSHVHQAVIEAGEKESGITIHMVNEHYDEGAIVHQSTCEVMQDDTPDSLAARIHKLEYEHYPRVIESVVLGHQP